MTDEIRVPAPHRPFETREELIEYFKSQSAFESNKGRAFIHDLEYLWGHLDDILDRENSGSGWHNAALGFMLDSEEEAMMEGLLRGGPLELMQRVKMLLATWFILGYEAGEGPEHIDKCTDVHDPDRN